MRLWTLAQVDKSVYHVIMVSEPQVRWARWMCGQRADRQLTIRIPRRTWWQRTRMEGWRWTIFSSIWSKHCVTCKRRWSGSSSMWPIRVDAEWIFVQQGHPGTCLGCRRRGWRWYALRRRGGGVDDREPKKAMRKEFGMADVDGDGMINNVEEMFARIVEKQDDYEKMNLMKEYLENACRNCRGEWRLQHQS